MNSPRDIAIPNGILTRRIPYAVVAVVITLSLIAPAQVERAQAWPLLISIVLVGLPHGAGDNLVPVWAGAERCTFFYVSCFFVGYLALVALVWALWLISPALGIVYFLGITIWHWGSADASDALPDAIGKGEWVARSLSRGAIIIAGPLAAHFAAASTVIASLALAFHSNYKPSENLRSAAEVAAVAAIVAELLTGLYKREWRQLAETILLAALVIAAPPLAAIGAYFLGWHSLRHLARLTSLRTSSEGWSWREFGRTYAYLVPLTLAAIALLIGMGEYLRVRPNQQSVLAVYLILISALTLPHAMVTGWLDWKERAGDQKSNAF